MPSSWWVPSRSRSRTGGSTWSSGRSTQAASTASYVPRPRSVPYASSVANAASRGVQAALAQQRRQGQVGVGVALVHRAQQVERDPARQVGARLAPARRPALLPLRSAGRSPEACRRRRRARPGPSRPRPSACCPAGRTSPSRTAWPSPVPTRTSRLPADTWPGASPLAATSPGATGSTGPRPSRSPPQVVQAPGAGVQARTRRSTWNAGADQSTRASSTVSLGARLTPSAGCGTATSSPRSMASRVATSRPAPAVASRPSRSPLVSRRAGSSRSSRRQHRAGVETLLEGEHRGTGDVVAVQDRVLHRRRTAPGGQQREVQVHPAVRPAGRAAPGGTSAPYATTGQQSGASSSSRSRRAGSRGAGRLQRLDTGLGGPPAPPATRPACRPRPAGRPAGSGRRRPRGEEASRASSAGTATSGVPAKTRRIEGAA